MVNTDPRSRLLELSAQTGVSLAALSALIGRNGTYLQQFVRKGSPRRLEERDRRKLAEFFAVSESELGAALVTGDDSPALIGKKLRSGWLDVPRLALGASAGPGALAGEEQDAGAFRFGAAWLRAQGLDPAMLSAIAVSGDSMEPTLRDGDEILVDRTPRVWREGVHVVRVGDSLLVKRLDFSLPGQIALLSDNPSYRALELPAAEVTVIGRVVWKSGRL